MRFLKSLTLALTSLSVLATAQNCNLIVPKNPLTAAGLATPYLLTPTTTADTCTQTSTGTMAFVQGVILNLDTGNLTIYNPLVIDSGTTAAITPLTPALPPNSVVGIWFGFNGATLTLQADVATKTSLTSGNCVNGNGGTNFGQFAYCNAPNFFSSARTAIEMGLLTVPALGTANDGLTCPTTRDWMVVDQDQSDNVVTTYLLDPNTNKLAQDTPANRAALGLSTAQANGSDNRLLDIFILPALGCSPWKVPDLAANAGQSLSALPLNEIQAEYYQAAPKALLPAGDPMTLDGNGNPSNAKLNAYRNGVFQSQVTLGTVEAPTELYCQRIVNLGAPRIIANKAKFQALASPMDGINLFVFLQARMNVTMGAGGLNCSPATNAAFNALAWGTATTTGTVQTLSTGAIAGIAVGATALAAVICGGCIVARKNRTQFLMPNLGPSNFERGFNAL